MIWTLIVYFVAEFLDRNTVLALLIRFMLAFTFSFSLRQEMLETLMLYLHLILLSSAIWALFIGSMTTGWLDIFNGFLSYSQTIDTSSIGPMSAMRFLDFFFSQGLGLMLMKGWALILL
jgi:hypothetical protein